MQDEIFSCQVTNLIKATSPLPKGIRKIIWNISCDIRSRSFRPLERLRLFLLWWNYKIQKFLFGKKYYTSFSTILLGKKNWTFSGRSWRPPTVTLNLQPGELVEVRSKEEILSTLDAWGKNRGLEFIRGMLKYCGGRYRVLKRLDKRIMEETGKMRHIANTVLLEGVCCDGNASGRCQRMCYCLWREIWLKRIK